MKQLLELLRDIRNYYRLTLLDLVDHRKVTHSDRPNDSSLPKPETTQPTGL